VMAKKQSSSACIPPRLQDDCIRNSGTKPEIVECSYCCQPTSVSYLVLLLALYHDCLNLPGLGWPTLRTCTGKFRSDRFYRPYNFFNLSSLFPILFFWSLTSAPNCCFVVFFSIRLVCRSALTAAFLAFLSSFDSFRGRVIVSRRGTKSSLTAEWDIMGREAYRHCQNPQIHPRYL
jgi:hypothetical protein